MKIKYIVAIFVAAMMSTQINAQQQLTREQILSMSIEELSDLPLEDLMQAVETLGVSSVDELFALIMNKNVSSASKTEEDSFISPLSSTVITRDEMRTYGISTIEEAFRLIPGMIVTEKTNGIYDIQMRGLNNIPDNNMYLYTENSNTLLLIDGRPVYNNAMGAINFDMLPIGIEDVERIEVVRGACSALYGANAVTGLINIITERPNNSSNLISGNIQMGSQDTYIGEFAIRKAFNNKIAAGVTFNMQQRNRPTDKLWLIPASGTYLPTVAANMPPAGAELHTPYFFINTDQTPTKNYDPEGLSEAMKSYFTIFGNPQDPEHFPGSMTDVSKGGWLTIEEIQNLKQIYPTYYNVNGDLVDSYTYSLKYGGQGGTVAGYRLFDSNEPEAPISSMIPDPEKSRNTIGLNAYINFTPNENMNFYLSGGYQNSNVIATPVGDDVFSFNRRVSKTAYVALDANIYDFHFLANYMAGPQDYALGVAGFKVHPTDFNISAEYDFNLDCGLHIRPGFAYRRVFTEDYSPVWDDKENYQWHYEDPGYRYDSFTYENLTGFFQYTCEMTTFAPSVRLDYKLGNIRLIGAYRADKTNIPDKWQHSWQFAANYSINDRNFIRLVYGRANRGANMVNAKANYTWTRTNMLFPNQLHFSANEEADLMNMDNIELGYRWKPTNKLLIDAEAFYSISRDYSALMAHSATMNVTNDKMKNIIYKIREGLDQYEAKYGDKKGLAQEVANNPALIPTALGQLMNGVDLGLLFMPYANIMCESLPYEAHQMGISLNADYIISSKLLAKVNANFQSTKIDNYYTYSQANDIMAMLAQAIINTNGDVMNRFQTIIQNYLQKDMNLADASNDAFKNDYNNNLGVAEFGRTSVTHDKSKATDNGFKHKATPSFYGMIGLIYKPIKQLECSAFANFIGKRTYNTKYGSDELGNRCTVNMKVGYKPIDKIEVFFNAHNLLNTQKREFTHCDEINGIYTVGVNFGF